LTQSTWSHAALYIGAHGEGRLSDSSHCFIEADLMTGVPTVEYRAAATEDCPGCVDEIMHIRHHSLFVPRDFDVSPYFRIIKPTIETRFDFRTLKWG
jgi:hypothetical protein